MYTCEICKHSWTNEENREYNKYIPFRCPKCRQDRECCKREDLDYNKFKPKSLSMQDGYFPPPWNISDFPEKTLGWVEFQKAMKENPEYYL